MRQILITGLLLLGLHASAQSNEAIATVPAHGLEIKQDQNLSYAEFDVATTAEFMEYMMAESQRYANSFVFEVTALPESMFHCKMGFLNIQAVPQNFHKMFLALGINKIAVNGQLHSVNDLLNLK